MSNVYDSLTKEKEMVHALNGKTVSELNNNLKSLMKNLFGIIDDSLPIKAYLVEGTNKTDFVIEYDDRQRNVSMKSGAATVVHNEQLPKFIAYLESVGISKRTCDTICLFHYGDGTTDGSNPDQRQNYQTVFVGLEERIREANRELNASMELIEDFVIRFVFKGADENNIEADCLYFGDVDYGVVVTKKQVLKSIQRRTFDYYENLHLGPILIRPDSRYVDKEIASTKNRNRIVCYIPNLRATCEYIARRYSY